MRKHRQIVVLVAAVALIGTFGIMAVQIFGIADAIGWGSSDDAQGRQGRRSFGSDSSSGNSRRNQPGPNETVSVAPRDGAQRNPDGTANTGAGAGAGDGDIDTVTGRRRGRVTVRGGSGTENTDRSRSGSAASRRLDTGGRSAFAARYPSGFIPDSTYSGEQSATTDSAETDPTGAQGFVADYFDFDRVTLRRFPHLFGVPFTVSRIESTPAYPDDASFKLPFPPESFAARYAAILMLDAPGDYEFFVSTNGNALVTINGQQVCRKDHDFNGPTGTAGLSAGDHELVMHFYDNFGSTLLYLLWRPPGGIWEPIPDELLMPLFLPDRDPKAPVVMAVEPTFLQTARRCVVRAEPGHGFCDVATYNRIRFTEANGRRIFEGEVRYADAETVVGVVPDIAGSFNLQVVVGPPGNSVVSQPIPVFVGDATFGLLGSYLRVGQPMSAMPPITAPDMLRIDKWINFNSEHSFKLPFPAKYFAGRWDGFVEISEPGTHTLVMDFRGGAGLTWTFNGQPMPAAQPVEMALEPGFYPVTIEFYYNTGYPMFRLLEFPGPLSAVPEGYWVKGIPERGGTAVMPPEYLWPPSEFRSADQPRVYEITPNPMRIGREIRLRGRGFSTAPGAVKVWFRTVEISSHGATTSADDGMLAEIIAVTAEEIRARVPPLPGEGQYFVTVAVNNLFSDGLHVDVTGELGLVGEYVALAAPVEAPFDWDGDVPFIDTIDLEMPSVDEAPEALGPGPFAARWRGTFWAHQSGEYRFTFETDAHITVVHDGKTYFTKPFTATPMQFSGSITMDKGLYSFVLKATFAGDNPYLRVRLMPPNEPEREITWTDGLPPEDYEKRERPEILTISPAVVTPGAPLTLTCSHLDGGTRFHVVFPTGANYAKMAVTAARAGNRLTVTVPADVAPGKLTVIVDRYRSREYLYEREYPTPNGLRGRYYRLPNVTLETFPNLSGREPTMIRRDAILNFANDPSFKLPFVPDNFSVVWDGLIYVPEPGVYRFVLGSDDGSRLIINNVQVIDNDGIHAYEEVEGHIMLTAGYHPIQVEMFENFGAAAVKLFWIPPGSDDDAEPVLVPTEALFKPGYVPPSASGN